MSQGLPPDRPKPRATARAATLPVTGLVDRGELGSQLSLGRCLVWLFPSPPPRLGADVPKGVRLVGPEASPAALLVDLMQHPELWLRRAHVSEPRIAPSDGALELLLPSTDELVDVSRSPARLRWSAADELFVTPGSARARIWLGLRCLTGSTAAFRVEPWGALAVGPLVLWYLPLSPEDALPLLVPPAEGPLLAPGGFLAASEASAALVTQVRRMAGRRALAPALPGVEPWDHGEPFLLAGETGVGKNLLASAALADPRPSHFAVVQPHEVRGWVDLVPFYGARGLAHDGRRVRDRPGRLEVLRHPSGLLLFDEIHSLDEEFRYRLVELLTYWTFRPRGDEGVPLPIRGLPVFATSRPDEVRDPARFPPDLFYRMGGEANLLVVPPLRSRRAEILALAEHLVASGPTTSRVTLTPDARRKLLLHDWPGNVRELGQALSESASRAGPAGIVGPELLRLGGGQVHGSPHGSPHGPASTPATSPATSPAAGPGPRVAAHLIHHEARASAHAGVLAPAPGASPELAPGTRASRLRWTDLVLLRAHLPSLDAVKESLVTDRQRLGRSGANRAAVNREIGRLVRCDEGPRPGCTQSLCCRLVDLGPGPFLAELGELLREDGFADARAWGILAEILDDLVVERLGRQRPALLPMGARLRIAARSPDAPEELALVMEELASLLGTG